MSKVAITGNENGSGIFTIAAPNSNTDRTITLPDAGGTILTSGSFVTVDETNGRLGIGDNAPLDKVHIYEDVNSATATQLLLQNEGAGNHAAGIAFQVSSSGETTGFAPKAGIVFERQLANGRGSLKFFNDIVDDANGFSATDEVMRITSAGYVGIGTSSPLTNLVTVGTTMATSQAFVGSVSDTSYSGGIINLSNSSRSIGITSDPTNAGAGSILNFSVDGTERMRLTSGGDLLLNTTTASVQDADAVGIVPTVGRIYLNTTDESGLIFLNQSYNDTVARYQILFYRSEAFVGSITSSSTSTAYNTTSDYRLKENLNAISNGIDRVKQLNPLRFNFIANPEKTVDGFLAHEVDSIVPEAITGAKDATKEEEYEVTPAVLDDDGNVVTEAVMGTRTVPDYQGIDQSKLVPLLTAALQEAITKIEALEARVTALENA